MRLSVLFALSMLMFAPTVDAKSAITSSEQTHARVCIDARASLDRLLDACTTALGQPGLTIDQRADLLVALGEVYSWRNNDDLARETFEEALAIAPGHVEALNGLGWVVRVVDGDAAAFEVFDRSLARRITVQALAGKAATGRTLGAFDEATAREMLRAALAIDPDYLWALREIGWSFHDEGLNSEAAAIFEDALIRDPTDTNAVYGLARAQLRLGDPATALENFNKVIGDTPEKFAALVYRIIALRDLDRNAQALREADRLIEAYPDRTSGYIEKGLALMALERRADAITTFANADAALGPDNALLYWYADALIYDGRFDEAMDIINRGLALDGADYSDYLLKSYIALEMRDYPLAKEAAVASLETGVNDPWAHYYIAITLVHEGQVAKALDRFHTAMDVGLPEDRVGAFASELVGAGKYVEAAQLRLKY